MSSDIISMGKIGMRLRLSHVLLLASALWGGTAIAQDTSVAGSFECIAFDCQQRLRLLAGSQHDLRERLDTIHQRDQLFRDLLDEFSSASKSSHGFSELLAAAKIADHLRRWQQCIELSSSALELSPNSFDAYLVLVRAMLNSGRIDEAIASSNRAILACKDAAPTYLLYDMLSRKLSPIKDSQWVECVLTLYELASEQSLDDLTAARVMLSRIHLLLYALRQIDYEPSTSDLLTLWRNRIRNQCYSLLSNPTEMSISDKDHLLSLFRLRCEMNRVAGHRSMDTDGYEWVQYIVSQMSRDGFQVEWAQAYNDFGMYFDHTSDIWGDLSDLRRCVQEVDNLLGSPSTLGLVRNREFVETVNMSIGSIVRQSEWSSSMSGQSPAWLKTVSSSENDTHSSRHIQVFYFTSVPGGSKSNAIVSQTFEDVTELAEIGNYSISCVEVFVGDSHGDELSNSEGDNFRSISAISLTLDDTGDLGIVADRVPFWVIAINHRISVVVMGATGEKQRRLLDQIRFVLSEIQPM